MPRRPWTVLPHEIEDHVPFTGKCGMDVLAGKPLQDRQDPLIWPCPGRQVPRNSRPPRTMRLPHVARACPQIRGLSPDMVQLRPSSESCRGWTHGCHLRVRAPKQHMEPPVLLPHLGVANMAQEQ